MHKLLLKKMMLSILFLLFISACGTTSSSSVTNNQPILIDIFSINDLHGELSEKTPSISQISQAYESSKNVKVLLSAGDSFQGTTVSNITQGKAVVRVMNQMKFDAMTIGNHEFDWGIDKISAFRDGNIENGEANFPILAANIFNKSTNTLIDKVVPYTILEKQGIKIGVIGIIGENLESSIATNMVKDYEFKDSLPIIVSTVKKLRNEEKVDIVIVNAHDDGSQINNSIAAFDQEAKVDAVINGHAHRVKSGKISRSSGANLPYVQSASSGKYYGKITLQYNSTTKSVIDASVSAIEVVSSMASNIEIDQVIREENAKVAPIINRKIGVSGEEVNQSQGIKWAVDVIKKAMDVDIAFTNSGGIRGAGFPIEINQEMIYDDFVKIMPFDNALVKTQLTGQQIIDVLNSQYSELRYSENLINISGIVYINQQLIELTKLYSVATVDYVFDKTELPFINGINTDRTVYLLRDLLIADVEVACSNGGKWNPSNGSVLDKVK